MSRLLFSLLFLPFVLSGTPMESPCDPIDRTFQSINDQTPACRCFQDSPGVSGDVWIGCSGHQMPAVFDSLLKLNESTATLSRLHIWDSLINIIPADMFSKVRPRSLTIERAELALLRDGAFTTISSVLKDLSLRKNILKRLEPTILKELVKLQSLDVSGNRITTLNGEEIGEVTQLTHLNMADNEMDCIEDGTFIGSPNIKILNLRGNKLTKITNMTFKGLSNLEQLDLSKNELKDIDWGAFSELKQLRVLDLGTNRLSHIQLRGLNHLVKLFINNNSILTLKHVSLRDLPSLSLLNIDRNSITTIGENDLFGLATSTKLVSLSLASNNISVITPRAFTPVSSISILALQNNELKSLSYETEPWLSPLKRLQSLLLSANSLTMLRNNELPSSLTLISLDHNRITKIDANAFSGLSPSHLFINNNHLNHLPRAIFNSFSNSTLQAIDLSGNDWLCLCGEEWLGEWLNSNSQFDVAEYRTNGCLSTKHCSLHDPHEDESHSTWVTAVAALLAAISLVILVAIAWLFIDDGRQRALPPHKEHKARGVNSDRLRLINEREVAEVVDGGNKGTNGGKRVRFDGE